MKRITLTLLSIFLITPCFANIHIMRETVEAVIKQKISGADAQVAALSEYNAQIKNAGGQNAGIPADGIWQVCTKAGWDISKPDGESKCRDFGNTLMKYASWTFKEVCGKDDFMIKRGTGQCVGDVFSNKILGGTKVNKLIANGLSKEYARVKYSENNLVCNTKIRQTTLPPDDYIQCLSMDKNMAYEFRFDSVTATADYVINEGTESGVCKIFGLKYSPSGYSNAATLGNGQTVGSYESWNSACETTDASICSKVNESMSRFGRSAKIGPTGSKSNKHNACVISGGSVSASNLRTAFGIDNYAFKNSGIQLNANVATQTQVCDWVKKTVKSPQITSCKCNDGFTQIYDFSGAITEIDDVLTCNINNKPVDFVFDDLSESNKKVAKGGAQGMDCMAAGGTYAGEQCINLDEQQCKLLASANLKNCPTCKRVKYQNGVCQLPSGADAENVQKNNNIAMIVGGAIFGVGITVITGGAGAVVVLTGIETLGAAIELGAQLKIDAIADEFLVQSNNCKSASCAKNLIKNNFQHLADSQNDFTVPEISAIDSEMARLANLIPENDDFWADIALNSLSMSDNQSGIFENWTPEQVWRAVGITLQMASVVTSVGKWLGTKAKTAVTKLSKSSKVLIDKTDDVIDAVERAQEGALSGNRLALKRKIAAMRAADPTAGMSNDDELWNALRRAYAPRNESLEHFKASFGGDIQKAMEQTKNMAAWDYDSVMAIQDKLFERRPDIWEYVGVNGPDAAADKFPEYRAILESRVVSTPNSIFDDMLREYTFWDDERRKCGGDLKCLEGPEEALKALRERMNNTPGYWEYMESAPYGNYSTWDSDIRKIKRDAQQQIAARDRAMDQIRAIDEKDMAAQKTNIKKQTTDKVLYEVRDNVSISNLDEVALMRADQIHDIIESDPLLQAQKGKWYKMTTEEKVKFAQDISDKLLIKNGVPQWNTTQIVSEKLDLGTHGAYFSSLNRTKIDFEQVQDYEHFINTLAHENGGHAIDYLNPNAGALGAQLQDATKDLYGGAYDAYRAKPTEQSAWRIGDVASVLNTFSKEGNTNLEDLLLDVVAHENVGVRIYDGGTGKFISGKYNDFGTLWTDLFKTQKDIGLAISPSDVENGDDVIDVIKQSGLFNVQEIGNGWWTASPIR